MVTRISKNVPKLLMLLLLCGTALQAFAEDQWFCKEGASRMLGDVMESCGIGKSADEATARKKALEGAFEEFDDICSESVNCRDYEKTVEPMRTECIQGKDKKYTCYRALDFTITHIKKEKKFADSDKKKALVSAITQNTDAADANPASSPTDGANPALAQTGTPPPSSNSTTIYRYVRTPAPDPFVYMISSQPQIVYVKSQLPPQYVPAPPAPPSAPKSSHRGSGHAHHGSSGSHHSYHPKKGWKKSEE